MDLDFIINNQPVYFITLPFDENGKVSYTLIELLFYKNVDFLHFHTNEESKEKMLIISEKGYEYFIEKMKGENIYFRVKSYYLIQMINTNEYMDDIGLVSKVSTLFSNNNIPILYITTSQSNFIFVEEKDLDISKQILNQLTNYVSFV